MGRDDCEGSLGDLEEQPGRFSRRSEIGNGIQSPFFVDSRGVTAQELASYTSMENIIYNRSDVAVLGTDYEAEGSEGMGR